MTQQIDYSSVNEFDPKKAVMVPVVLLYVAAGFGLISGLVTLAMGIFMLVAGSTPSMAPARTPAAIGPGVIAIAMVVLSLLNLAVYGMIGLGARRLQQLRSYALVMTAAILAVAPLFTCFTWGLCSIPMVLVSLVAGVWTLVVILRPEIKAAFV